jgi:hypothetical protein
MNESKIIFLHEPEQWRFWRESRIVVDTNAPGFEKSRHTIVSPYAATMAYSVGPDGKTSRVWWLWAECSHLDGCDPPREMETIAFEFVHPQQIKPSKPSGLWLPSKDPQRLHARLEQRPERLLRRWAEWEYKHTPRVVLPPPEPKTKWERFKGFFFPERSQDV